MPHSPLISTAFYRTVFFVFCGLLYSRDVLALKNITIDDQDAAITYTPAASWVRINDSSTVTFDFDGGHMLTSDPAATATFSFTGVAIYFLSARWPYAVNTSVTLDNGNPVLLDLVDHTRPDVGGGPATVKSQVVAKAVGLKNVTHKLTVSVGQGQLFALVDGLIYTTLATGETDPNAVSNSPTQFTPVAPSNSTTTTSTASKTSKATKLAIGLSILGVVILILLLVALWFCYRRREKRSQARSTYSDDAVRRYSLHDPPVGGSGTRDMRRAYGDDDEKDDLRVANPDPNPGSPASDTPTVRDDGIAGVGAGSSNARIAMPTPHHGAHDPDGDENPQRLQSPGRFYGALRDMTHSPARAYPVRDGRLSGRDTMPSTESASVYTDSRGRSTAYSGAPGGYVDDNGMLVPPRAQGQGRERASGRSSALAVESELPGEDRWAYPQAPLAYVPVFKQ